MRAEYKRDVSHNYLILEEEEEINTSSYQVRMLTGNVVPSMLRCRMQNLDGKIYFYYEITSRQPVSSYFEDRKLGAEDLRVIFGGFVRVMEELAEYLLNPEQLLLHPDYIYLDIEAGTVFFCCLPGSGREVQAQLRDLIEYMLPKLAHEDQEAVLLGYGIYRKILEPGFQMEMIKKAVYQEEKAKDIILEGEPEKESVLPAGEEQKLHGTEAGEKYEKDAGGTFDIPWQWLAGCGAGILIMAGLLGGSMLGYLPWLPAEAIMACGTGALGLGGFAAWISGKLKRRKEKTASWKQKIGKETGVCESSGANPKPEGKRSGRLSPAAPAAEENVLPWMEAEAVPASSELSDKEPQYSPSEKKQQIFGETVALSAGLRTGPASLVSREPGELAAIYLEQEFTVIGKLANAADAVIPVPTVSRVHARIRKKDEEYYLADLNSRNGTTVNGRLLKNDEEYQLQDEDEVDFAEARYIFLK